MIHFEHAPVGPIIRKEFLEIFSGESAKLSIRGDYNVRTFDTFPQIATNNTCGIDNCWLQMRDDVMSQPGYTALILQLLTPALIKLLSTYK